MAQNQGRGGRKEGSGTQNQRGSQGRENDRVSQEDLKAREYRGADGEIHHHTHTYMEQHEGEGGSSRRGGSNRSSGRNRSGGNG